MLNTNLWMFVGDHWRIVYGYATLYKIILMNSIQDSKDEALIKLCDLGLLMSGHLLKQKFQKIIKLLNTSKLSSSLSYVSNISSYKASVEIKKSENKELITRGSELLVINSPSVDSFKVNYFDKEIPVIIADQMNHWPAMHKWRYFKDIKSLSNI